MQHCNIIPLTHSKPQITQKPHFNEPLTFWRTQMSVYVRARKFKNPFCCLYPSLPLEPCAKKVVERRDPWKKWTSLWFCPLPSIPRWKQNMIRWDFALRGRDSSRYGMRGVVLWCWMFMLNNFWSGFVFDMIQSLVFNSWSWWRISHRYWRKQHFPARWSEARCVSLKQWVSSRLALRLTIFRS